jgi:hypothetical protein
MNFRIIYTPGTAYGGYSYRATSNGETVHIQERSPSSGSYRTKLKLTTEEWEEYVERNGLDDPYRNTNPAPIAYLANLKEGDYIFD